MDDEDEMDYSKVPVFDDGIGVFEERKDMDENAPPTNEESNEVTQDFDVYIENNQKELNNEMSDASASNGKYDYI